MTAAGVGRAFDGGVRIDLQPIRPWQMRWQRTLQLRDDLAVVYDTPGVELHGDLRSPELVYDLADSCFEVKDALIRYYPDLRQVVEAHANRAGSALRLIGDVTNTNKHWGRDESKPLAWVSPLFRHAEDGRISLCVTHDLDGETSTERDALELADAALDEWRAFFATHSLSESL